MPSFEQIYQCLQEKGSATVISSRGTRYSVKASMLTGGARKGERVIKAIPGAGCVYVHSDCWGQNETCQKTRAGGIYNGQYSIYDWYRDNYK